jgi:hypothetical protein
VRAAEAEEMLDEDTGVQAWAGGIDAPSPIDGDTARPDAIPRRAGPIRIVESHIAAAEVGVAMPQGRVGHPIHDHDRIGDKQSVPRGLALAVNAHGFRKERCEWTYMTPTSRSKKAADSTRRNLVSGAPK